MKILILEDDTIRHHYFRMHLGINHDVKIVERADLAIKELKDNGPWDLLFLDHDLGGETYVESGPGTGYEVAKWLEVNHEYLPKKIVLHSLNAYGRQNMLIAILNALRNCSEGYTPDRLYDQPWAWMKLNENPEYLREES